MARLNAFIHVTLDGFFAGPSGEIDWFKDVARADDYDRYTRDSASAGGTLVFGRTTYQMMKSWWPTEQARHADPRMARVVNESPKVVFSRTLRTASDEPHWKSVTVEHDLSSDSVRRLKDRTAADLTVLGSGTVLQQLANLGAVDEYALVIVPLVLGAGRPLFRDVRKTALELRESRSFANGLTLLRYSPKSVS